jgi:ABC-type transporter Mla subunit MlaD
LELGIKENIDRLKIIERKLRETICEGGPGSDHYNDLFNNFTSQLQTITNDFNDQISALKKKIPSLPISSENVNYIDFYNNTTKLKNTAFDFSKQLTYLTSVVCQCDNISSNFTTHLNSMESTFNTKISTLENTISSLPKFPLSANDMNYVDVNYTSKNLETHLKSVYSQLNDITTLLSNITSYYNGKISRISSSLYQCTDLLSEITNQTNTTTNTFNDQISALKNIIPTLPLSAAQVNYTKTDESIV